MYKSEARSRDKEQGTRKRSKAQGKVAKGKVKEQGKEAREAREQGSTGREQGARKRRGKDGCVMLTYKSGAKPQVWDCGLRTSVM